MILQWNKWGAAVVLAALASGLWAHEAVQTPLAVQQAQPAGDAQAIARHLKQQFDQPQAPLSVAPVSVVGAYAVAGWTQGSKGGRALLRKSHGRWSIQACGGDGLTQAAVLEQAGLSPAEAKQLAQLVQSSEARLSAAQRRQLDSFGQVMPMTEADHHKH